MPQITIDIKTVSDPGLGQTLTQYGDAAARMTESFDRLTTVAQTLAGNFEQLTAMIGSLKAPTESTTSSVLGFIKQVNDLIPELKILDALSTRILGIPISSFFVEATKGAAEFKNALAVLGTYAKDFILTSAGLFTAAITVIAVGGYFIAEAISKEQAARQQLEESEIGVGKSVDAINKKLQDRIDLLVKTGQMTAEHARKQKLILVELKNEWSGGTMDFNDYVRKLNHEGERIGKFDVRPPLPPAPANALPAPGAPPQLEQIKVAVELSGLAKEEKGAKTDTAAVETKRLATAKAVHQTEKENLDTLEKEQSKLVDLSVQEAANRVAAVKGNTLLTDGQKRTALIGALSEQRGAVVDSIAYYEVLGFKQAFLGKSVADTITKISGLRKEMQALTQEQKQQQLAGSFTGEFANVTAGLQNKWGSWAKQSASVFQTVFEGAISTISSGIEGLIQGTKTWTQALQQVGSTILTSIINAIVQMGVRWVLTQLFMALAGKAILASATAATAPIAAAQSAIWTVPATLATIASYGAAALAAPGFIALAEGLTLMQSVTALATGGPVEAGMPYIVGDGGRPELFVPSQSGYVLPSVPKPMDFAARGGSAGNSNASSQPVELHVYPVHDSDAAVMRTIQQHNPTRAIILDLVKNQAKFITGRA